MKISTYLKEKATMNYDDEGAETMMRLTTRTPMMMLMTIAMMTTTTMILWMKLMIIFFGLPYFVCFSRLRNAISVITF